MRRLLRSVTTVLALSAVPATAAASGFSWNDTVVCGGNTFATCASVNVATTYDAATHTVSVTMRVTNLSGANNTYAGTIFTQMGLFNLPKGVNYGAGGLTVVDQNGNAVSGWQLGANGLSGAGIGTVVRGVDPTNGINGGLAAPGAYTFTFTLTGWNGAPDFNTIGFAVHGQGGPNGCSTKMVVTNGVANQGTPGTCTTVTPEPVSMTLLATGLTAVAGVGAIRRRRKQTAA